MALLKVDLKPNQRALRQFSVIWLVAFIAIGGWIALTHSLFVFDFSAESAQATGWILATIGVIGGVLGLALPKMILPIYIALMLVALPIGFAISYLVIGFIFYGVVLPIGLVRRALGRDSLSRSFLPKRNSYWQERDNNSDVARYFRQY